MSTPISDVFSTISLQHVVCQFMNEIRESWIASRGEPLSRLTSTLTWHTSFVPSFSLLLLLVLLVCRSLTARLPPLPRFFFPPPTTSSSSSQGCQMANLLKCFENDKLNAKKQYFFGQMVAILSFEVTNFCVYFGQFPISISGNRASSSSSSSSFSSSLQTSTDLRTDRSWEKTDSQFRKVERRSLKSKKNERTRSESHHEENWHIKRKLSNSQTETENDCTKTECIPVAGNNIPIHNFVHRQSRNVQPEWTKTFTVSLWIFHWFVQTTLWRLLWQKLCFFAL